MSSFGKFNPSGHLPVTWPSASDHNAGDFDSGGPSTAGDEPKFFDQLPGTNSGQGSGYNPRWPFGFGLSYTTFATSGLSATSSVSRHGTVTATFTVANTGSRDGATVVPVYVSQAVSDVVVPPKRLVGFARVDLAAGASPVVHVSFPVSELAVTPDDIDSSERPAVERGNYKVVVGVQTRPTSRSRVEHSPIEEEAAQAASSFSWKKGPCRRAPRPTCAGAAQPALAPP